MPQHIVEKDFQPGLATFEGVQVQAYATLTCPVCELQGKRGSDTVKIGPVYIGHQPGDADFVPLANPLSSSLNCNENAKTAGTCSDCGVTIVIQAGTVQLLIEVAQLRSGELRERFDRRQAALDNSVGQPASAVTKN